MRPAVAIIGGGLAGLTLSLQLEQRFPGLNIVVLERRRHPVPEAAHKVGESSVEIAANYFDAVLGLKDHLVGQQLKKFGFRFFFSEGRRDIDSVLQLGASSYLSTPSYQLDRGLFENFLGNEARKCGAAFLDGVVVRGVELGQGEADHRVRCERDGVKMCIDITKSIFRNLANEGVVLSEGLLRTLQVHYLSTAQDTLKQYEDDAAFACRSMGSV